MKVSYFVVFYLFCCIFFLYLWDILFGYEFFILLLVFCFLVVFLFCSKLFTSFFFCIKFFISLWVFSFGVKSLFCCELFVLLGQYWNTVITWSNHSCDYSKQRFTFASVSVFSIVIKVYVCDWMIYGNINPYTIDPRPDKHRKG